MPEDVEIEVSTEPGSEGGTEAEPVTVEVETESNPEPETVATATELQQMMEMVGGLRAMIESLSASVGEIKQKLDEILEMEVEEQEEQEETTGILPPPEPEPERPRRRHAWGLW